MAGRHHRARRLLAAGNGGCHLGPQGTGGLDQLAGHGAARTNPVQPQDLGGVRRLALIATGSRRCTDRQLDKLWAEDRDEAYERFFGVGASFDAVLAQPSISSEERGSLAEPSRFGTLARRVFQPLLAVEDLR